MAPVLLDNRGLLKVAVSMVLALVVVFGGGFVTGYQKAVVQQLALTQNRGIELPQVDAQQAEALAMTLVSRPPAIEEAGALIDVDNPNNDSSLPALKTEVEGRLVSSIVDDSILAIISENVEISERNFPAPFVVSNETVEDEKITKPEVLSGKTEQHEKDDITQAGVLKKTQSNIVKSTGFNSALVEVNKFNARYSIQVGMYGQRVNASNLAKMLETQGLDAYISEYLNKKQQLRYNVRFGYFENKRAALKGLKYYTDNMDGKGYLVRFKQTMHAENNRSTISVPTDKTAEF